MIRKRESGIVGQIKNERGIALLTSLLLTLITLAMILVALYMVTSGTKISGLFKSYRTGVEASYGAADLITKDFIPQKITGITLVTLGTYGGRVAYGVTDACFTTKLTSLTATWGLCSSTLDPTDTPDITFTLTAAAGAPYTVDAKIVDTTAGNTDTSGLNLIGAGVVEGGGGSGIITPQHIPFMYRIEVQGQRQSNPDERASLSLLYGY